MSHPSLDPDLAAALEVLEPELGPLQVLDVHPTLPRRRPDVVSPAPAVTTPEQPNLFDPEPEPAPPATTDPSTHPGRDPRPTAPLPTPDTRRRTA
jgi:hypothetical protein